MNILDERKIRVSYTRGKFSYIGRYNISVYNNALVQVARARDITVDPWIDIDPDNKDEVEAIIPTDENPMGFSVTIKGYDYDSMANRIASQRYNYNQDTKMIAKFMAEAHFDSEAIGQAGEQ
jgi:hypothetical protein